MDINLEKLYYQICEAINALDFDAIWKGFRPLKFALYNDTECFFDGQYIEKTADFCANTSIEYKGEIIAIWNVEEEMAIPKFTSCIVHEMFHAFQEKQGWECFPNEMEALLESGKLKILLQRRTNSFMDIQSVQNQYGSLLQYQRFALLSLSGVNKDPSSLLSTGYLRRFPCNLPKHAVLPSLHAPCLQYIG